MSFVALSRKIGYDEALRELLEHFNITLSKTLLTPVPQIGQSKDEEDEREYVESKFESPPAPPPAPAKPLKTFETKYEKLQGELRTDPSNLEILEAAVDLCRSEMQQDYLIESLRQYGLACANQNQFEHATSALAEYLETRPDDLEARQRYADCLSRLGRREDWISEIMRLASKLEDQGKTDESLAFYREIESLGTDFNRYGPFYCAVIDIIGPDGRSRLGNAFTCRTIGWRWNSGARRLIVIGRFWNSNRCAMTRGWLISMCF